MKDRALVTLLVVGVFALSAAGVGLAGWLVAVIAGWFGHPIAVWQGIVIAMVVSALTGGGSKAASR